MSLTYLIHKDGTDFSPWRYNLSLEFLRIVVQILYVRDEMSLGEMLRKEVEDGETRTGPLSPRSGFKYTQFTLEACS